MQSTEIIALYDPHIGQTSIPVSAFYSFCRCKHVSSAELSNYQIELGILKLVTLTAVSTL